MIRLILSVLIISFSTMSFADTIKAQKYLNALGYNAGAAGVATGFTKLKNTVYAGGAPIMFYHLIFLFKIVYYVLFCFGSI